MSTLLKRLEQALQASRAAPARVNLTQGTDFKCALLGSLGFSTRYISEHTAYSTGQISYRLRLGGIKRSDYRNGTSSVAGTVLNHARQVAIPEVTAHLNKVLLERAAAKGTAQNGI